MVSAPYPVAVSATRSRVVDYCLGRSSVIIFNAGTVTVYLGTDESLSSDSGIPILVNTGIVFAREYGDDPDLARYAVTVTDAGNLRIQEEMGAGLWKRLTELVELLKK